MSDPSFPASAPAELRTAKAVQDDLLPLLTEIFPSIVPVHLSGFPDDRVRYNVNLFGSHCSFGVRPHTETTASVSARIDVGRFHTGYRRAIRWFFNNRAFNSVTLTMRPVEQQNREICLHCLRLTAPGDIDGLRAMLRDIHNECAVVERAVRMWFPHAVLGSVVAHVLEKGDPTPILVATQPRQFLQYVDQHPEEPHSLLALIHSTKWLRQWERMLSLTDPLLLQEELDPNTRKNLLLERVRPLLELKRYDALAATITELRSTAEAEYQTSLIGVEAQMLYEQGLYEDALELVRSAELDSTPRVLYVRALSHRRLGNFHEAWESIIALREPAGDGYLWPERIP